MSKELTKPFIRDLVIVEGKSDTQKLKSLYVVDTIETNGSAMDNGIINLIIESSKTREILIFTDADYTGENIRKKLQSKLINCKHAFIPSDSNSPCVAESQNLFINKALANFVTFNNESFNAISWNEYLKLNLNSKNLRKKLCAYLKITYCNNKQLYLRLNFMKKNFNEIAKFLGNNNDN